MAEQPKNPQRLHTGLRRLIVNAMSPRMRAARVARFVDRMRLTPGMRVIDLGGMPSFWRFCPVPLDITIVNLDIAQIQKTDFGEHRFTIVQGDVTRLDRYADDAFELAFSNSTIEHVGDAAQRAAFAREVRRLALNYYVQTPSIAFPYEVHTGLPFWWYYPRAARDRLVARWRTTNPFHAEFVAGTTIVRSAELRRLFPDGRPDNETVFGVKKSNIVWRAGAG